MSRKQKQYHFIYKTTDTRNDNFYIGMHSTDNLNDGYVGSGLKIKNIKHKYGKDIFNIEILEFLPDRKLLKKREEEIVNSDLLKEEKCMNLRPGGEGGFISEENQRYRSQCGGLAASKTGKNKERIKWLSENDNEWYTKWKTNIGESKIGNKNWVGKQHSDETKEKIGKTNSLKQKGNKNSQFGTCWITNGIENKKIKKEEINNYIGGDWICGCSKIGNIGRNKYSK